MNKPLPLLLLLLSFSSIYSMLIIMKDGTEVDGELLWQNKGKLIIKSGREKLTILKRSIRTIDGQQPTKELFPDSLILKDRNEYTVINESGLKSTVKIRLKETKEVIEKFTIENGKMKSVMVPNGSFYKTVYLEHSNPDSSIYIKTQTVTFQAPEKEFERVDFSIKEHINYPRLESLKRAYEW